MTAINEVFHHPDAILDFNSYPLLETFWVREGEEGRKSVPF